MTKLRISDDLALPLDFATEGIVVIGVRGSGKSNTEVRFAEQLHENGIPFLAIDPKGDWYGIRMDGEKPGLPVPVFGGLYGDFPIEERLGGRIADVAVDNNVSGVVDVSRMSHSARARFLTDLFRQLMERHQLEPHVRTVIFEEAHRYIPQQVSGPVAALKEAAAAVLLEGRSFGLGCWACTQRPARLHNDVLEEVDTAIIHRIGVTATADLKRVRDWVKHEDLGDEIGQSLTKLKAGEAWVLSPVSLGIVQRVQIARRTTFDSGATPVVGDEKTTRRRLATMADIDADAIKEALAETIERAKADDPKELHKRIAELERHKCPEPAAVEPQRIEVPVISQETREELLRAVGQLNDYVTSLTIAADGVVTAVATATSVSHATQLQRASGPQKSTTETSVTGRPSGRPSPSGAPRRPAATPTVTPVAERRPAGDGTTNIPKGERAVLAALAARDKGATREQLTLLTGYKKSTRNAYIQRLGNAGLVEIRGTRIFATDAGLNELGADYEPLPTGAALREHYLRTLPPGEAAVLQVLIDNYPAGVDRDLITDLTGYKKSTRNAYIQRLGTRELVTLVDGEPAAADTLFES